MSAPLAYGALQRVAEVKAAGDGAWEVSGYASVFGVRDYGNDVVHAGAFTESLKSGQRVRFLYAHNPADVLGSPLELREDDRGLFGRWRISKTRLGADVHEWLQDGALDSFSIGFIPQDFDRDEQGGGRNLRAVSLLECSLVALPMQPQALVTGFKSQSPAGQDYQELGLEDLLTAYEQHHTAALTQAKAVAERRLSEGRKLSDTALATLERLRLLAEADAAALLRLATTPPARPDTPRATAPVETAGGLVDAHLRRARLRELTRLYGVT